MYVGFELIAALSFSCYLWQKVGSGKSLFFQCTTLLIRAGRQASNATAHFHVGYYEAGHKNREFL